MGIFGSERNSLFAVTSGADFKDFLASTFGLCVRQDLQNVRGPYHLGHRSGGCPVGSLLSGGGARKDSKRAANCSVCINAGAATLHDGNYNDTEQHAGGENADYGYARPNAPRLVKHVWLGLSGRFLCH